MARGNETNGDQRPGPVDATGVESAESEGGGRLDRFRLRLKPWLASSWGRGAVVLVVLAVWVSIPKPWTHDQQPSVSTEKEFAAGQCVRPNDRGTYNGVDCADGSATGRILKVLDRPAQYADGYQCPEETDAILDVFERFRFSPGDAATELPGNGVCVRNLHPPNPGDRGAGGGIFRSGDCVKVGSAVVEEPCGQDPSAKRIVAVVETDDRCPRPGTQESVTLEDFRSRRSSHVLCFG